MTTHTHRWGMLLLIGGLSLGAAPTAPAQDPAAFNEIAFLTRSTGFGTRALGMGGAGLAALHNFNALYWNPAGMAFARRPEAYGAFANLVANNDASFFGSRIDGRQSFTRLNAGGVLYPVPVYRGGLTIGAGYGTVENFNSILEFEAFNDRPGDQVRQFGDVAEEGTMGVVALGAGVQVLPDLAVGLSVNFWVGSHRYSSILEEEDTQDVYTFSHSRTDQFVDSQIRGMDAKVGLQYQAAPHVRIGATIGFPRTLWIAEDFVDEELVFFDADADEEDTEDIRDGFFNYRVRLPFQFGLGAALTFSTATLAVDVEYTDWSQARYTSAPPLAGLSRAEANRNIRRAVQGAWIKRVGGEVRLPGLGHALRAGYYEIPSPYRTAFRQNVQQHLTFGAGLQIGPSASLDVAFIHGWWKQVTTDARVDVPIQEDRRDNKLFASLSVHF